MNAKETPVSAIELYFRGVDYDNGVNIMSCYVDWPCVPRVDEPVGLAPSWPASPVTEIHWDPYGPVRVALNDISITPEKIAELVRLGWKATPEEPSPMRGIGVRVL